MAPDVHIHDASMEVTSQKNGFLRNSANQKQLIKLFSSKFRQTQIDVRESKEDADTLTAKTPKNCPEDGSVVVASEDTDVLMILLHHWNRDSRDIFCCKKQETSKKAKTKHAAKNQTDEIGMPRKKAILMRWIIQRTAEPKKNNFILFAHAFLGCDMTSAVYGEGLVSFQ